MQAIRCRESVRNKSLILGLILSVTLLVYWNGLRNPFVPDDLTIIFRNFGGSKEWRLEDLWGRNLFGTAADQMELSEQAAYFRPLTLLTFAVNYPFARENPAAYRAVNVVFHLIVVLLAFLLFLRLAGKWTAGFAALIFAVHPANVQAVSYISSRSDPLYSAFALLCLLCWRCAGRAQDAVRPLSHGLGLLAFFLGLFAKENMVVLPVLVVTMDLIWNDEESWQSKLKKNFWWYFALALLFFLYLYVRVGIGFPLDMESGKELDLWLRVLLAFKLFGLYLGLAFYPVHLSLFRVIPIPQSLAEGEVALGFLLLLVVIGAAWLLPTRYKELRFGISWFLISTLPLLNLTLLNAPMMEHWLYFPMIGLALAMVSALRMAAKRLGEIRGAALALLLFALLLAVRTVTRNAEWKDHAELFYRDASTYPGNYLAWFWLGHALQGRGLWNDAIRATKTGLAINPDRRRAWLQLAECLSFAGRDDEADEAFSNAISLQPYDYFAHQLLGVHRLTAGNNSGAVEALNRSVSLKPSAVAYHALGSALLRLRQKEKAEEAFQKALLLAPEAPQSHAAAHVHLGDLYRGQRKLAEAREEWRLALRFDPDHPEAQRLLAQYSK